MNKDVRNDINIVNPANWRVYRSNTNLPNTWTEVPVQTITITLFDALNNIYRYEMQLSSAQDALYLKVVTMDTATITDVLVTEIEAWERKPSEKAKILKSLRFLPTGSTLAQRISLLPG